jgi:hypothetical protein
MCQWNEFCERAEKDKTFFTSSREAKNTDGQFYRMTRTGTAHLTPWYYFYTNNPSIIEIIIQLINIQEAHSRETERITRNRNTLLSLLNKGKPPEPEDDSGDQNGGSLESSINVEINNDPLVHIKREEIDWAEDAGLGEWVLELLSVVGLIRVRHTPPKILPIQSDRIYPKNQSNFYYYFGQISDDPSNYFNIISIH